MDKQTEAMKLALEALENFKSADISPVESFEQCETAITALQEALAEQQEPNVAICCNCLGTKQPHAADPEWKGQCDCKPPQPAQQHPDDVAIDRCAEAMKAKMARQRAKGYGGWDDHAACPTERLQQMLVDHIAKGDPVDVANFAMMLWNRGERTEQPAQQQEPVAWMHWLHGPVRLFLNKDEAQMELERLNREYPVDAGSRKMRPLVFGDTSPPASKPLTDEQVWNDDELMKLNAVMMLPMEYFMRVVRAIEAAHGIKGDA